MKTWFVNHDRSRQLECVTVGKLGADAPEACYGAADAVGKVLELSGCWLGQERVGWFRLND